MSNIYCSPRPPCDRQVAYGTTENSPVTFCPSPKDSVERKSETVGYIMDHVEVLHPVGYVTTRNKYFYIN